MKMAQDRVSQQVGHKKWLDIFPPFLDIMNYRITKPSFLS